MTQHKDQWNPPPPGTGESAKFTMDHNGYVIATCQDGTLLGMSKSVEALLQFAILRQLEGRST